MLMNGCPEKTSPGYIHWTSGVGQSRRVEMLRVLQTLAEMDRHYRVGRQVLDEPLSEADAAYFVVFLSPGSSRPTIG
jgi:hypothetical protein